MQKYSAAIRTLHWLMAIMMISIISVGIWMSSLPNDYPGKYNFYGLHKSFGVLFFIFAIIRIIAKIASKAPDYKGFEIKTRDIILGKCMHFILYFFMLAMPLSGYIMSTLGGHPVALFGLPIPSLEIASIEIQTILASNAYAFHMFSGTLVAGLIGLHILGALKHVVVDKQNILKRIWF